MYKKGNETSLFLIHNFVVVVVVGWQLSCRGSAHFLNVTVSLMQCPSTCTHTGTGTHFADLGKMTG